MNGMVNGIVAQLDHVLAVYFVRALTGDPDAIAICERALQIQSDALALVEGSDL